MREENRVQSYHFTANNAPLNPHHSHFILVKTDPPNWGDEIKLRLALEEFITSYSPEQQNLAKKSKKEQRKKKAMTKEDKVLI